MPAALRIRAVRCAICRVYNRKEEAVSRCEGCKAPVCTDPEKNCSDALALCEGCALVLCLFCLGGPGEKLCPGCAEARRKRLHKSVS